MFELESVDENIFSDTAQEALQTYDAVVVISTDLLSGVSTAIDNALAQAALLDATIGDRARLLLCADMPGSRLVHVPLHDMHRDYTDVRSIAEAAGEGVDMAVQAGARRPLLCIADLGGREDFKHAMQVAIAGVGQRLWQPLEARLTENESKAMPDVIGLHAPKLTFDCDIMSALEAARQVARDLAGTEPELMAPAGFEKYCEAAFADTAIAVEVEADPDTLEKHYPLLMAVSRASMAVGRHRPRVIRLEYIAPNATRTLFLVGKGVTYDTGGADIKTGGHMAGMSRDKGGAAAVAGIMKYVAEAKPEDVSVVALIGAVRNSIGSDAFVTDEIIKARSGQRVRIGNTDAEGRLVMADLLAQLCEEAAAIKGAVETQLFTFATLTGHAALCHGPYTAYVQNGSARAAGVAEALASQGDLWGDPGEPMRLRREDWHQNRPRSAAEDLVSSNPGPSVAVARGHQFPAAFLSSVAGLDDHEILAKKSIPYCHVDIAGSACEGGNWQFGKPTAAPISAFVGTYFLS